MNSNHNSTVEENIREAQVGQRSAYPPEPLQPAPQHEPPLPQARNHSRRIRRLRIRSLDDILSDDQNGEHRSTPDEIIIVSNTNYMSENARQLPDPKPELELETEPTGPIFNCPICMSQFTEEMSTRCGHIFCNQCIRAAIYTQGKKCPTCRKRVNLKDLRRVFLPAAN
ncbi:hypothetical protein RJT34_25496 [Clitoria ternatea]|uniref:RING-type domain-containing protein n=1 Tax=Clitoria ternatea TaxID=43366 RepID=A0AAN9IIJ6_CLITE